MQQPAIHDPISTATPYQLLEAAKRRARRERINALAKPDAGIVCLSASERTANAKGFARPQTFKFPSVPERPDYRCMWFYNLVFETEFLLPSILAKKVNHRPKITDIQRACAEFYDVKLADMLSERRTALVVRARQIAMYLAKNITMRSLPEIGRRFGGRDHTTVLHAVRKIAGLVKTDAATANDVASISENLGIFNRGQQ